jgi:hypothetical protein
MQLFQWLLNPLKFLYDLYENHRIRQEKHKVYLAAESKPSKTILHVNNPNQLSIIKWGFKVKGQLEEIIDNSKDNFNKQEKYDKHIEFEVKINFKDLEYLLVVDGTGKRHLLNTRRQNPITS